MSKKTVTVAIIGCGARGKDTYAHLKLKLGDEMEIVAAVDSDEKQLLLMQNEYGVKPENCFTNTDDFFKQGRIADVAFICTLDRLHYKNSIDALNVGYHLLLEKPISNDLKECREIEKLAISKKRFVVVCHVLRYTPFYGKLKELIDSGIIGDVVSIQAIEMVGYWHYCHSFVRGNWRNSDETSPMILQKCCHDFDIYLWLCGKHCEKVSSFGNLKLFKSENAPEGAAKRCLDNCKYVDTCEFSAPKYYLSEIKRGNKEWPVNLLNPYPTEENVMEALKTSDYGRCVYYCDNNVVDHQIVNLQLQDGVTIDFTMCAFTKNCVRKMRIMGTKGEIEGDMEANKIIVKPFAGQDTVIDVSTLADDFSGHAGGEIFMLKKLFELVRNEEKYANEISILSDSVESHYVAWAAEKSRLENGNVIDLETFKNSI